MCFISHFCPPTRQLERQEALVLTACPYLLVQPHLSAGKPNLFTQVEPKLAVEKNMTNMVNCSGPGHGLYSPDFTFLGVLGENKS